MGSSKKREADIRHTQRPDILLALRESLIEDSNGRFENRGAPRDAAGRVVDESSLKERAQLRAPIVDPAPDALPPAPNLQFGKIASESFGPAEQQDSVHIRDSIATAIASVQSPAKRSGASIVPSEESSELDLQQLPSQRVSENDSGLPPQRPINVDDEQSVASDVDVVGQSGTAKRRSLRNVGRTLLVLATVIAAFGALSYENDLKRDFAAARDASLVWVSSLAGSNLPAIADAKGSASTSETQAPVPVIKPIVPPSPPTPPTAVLAPEQLTKLDAIGSDLQALRHLITTLTAGQSQTARELATLQHRADDLAARQDQLARDLATLQETEANVSRRSLQSENTHSRPYKRIVVRRREPARPTPSFPPE
jgi:hypothetical protein